jgi:hypothetical protein
MRLRLTAIQVDILRCLCEYKLSDMTVLTQGYRMPSMVALQKKGLIKYQSYARPCPLWVITNAGREALSSHDVDLTDEGVPQ